MLKQGGLTGLSVSGNSYIFNIVCCIAHRGLLYTIMPGYGRIVKNGLLPLLNHRDIIPRMGDNVVYVDFTEGIKRVMNNAKLYIKLLTKFKNDTKLDDLETAIVEGDLEKAQGAAHTIKGIAANLSLTELFKQCLEIETQIKAKAVDPGQMETIKAVFAATLQEIDKVITENG